MEMLETLLEGVRSACAAFPDKRRGDVTYSMADIGLSAFSLFFMQSESFLAHQRALEEGWQMSKCHSLFGMTAVPTDNHIRAMPAKPRSGLRGTRCIPRTCSPPSTKPWICCVGTVGCVPSNGSAIVC